MANRRPSFAERPVTFTERRPSVVPHLAGLEKPLPETIPEQCDVVIAGTGLVESILASALAWQGLNVLHVDSNDYYGDNTATLTIDQLKEWVGKVNQGVIDGYKDAVLYIPSGNDKLRSKDFGIDLTPKILFAKSDLLSLLIKSRVYKYLEFLPLSSFHVFENDNFEKMSNSKQDIFTNQELSLITKRSLMKFIKFVLEYENNASVWADYKKSSIELFLVEKFKLEKPQISELIFAIGLCNTPEIPTPEALARIKRYLVSFDVYGNFPVMYSKYGGAGEISQGFCRSAAVAGTTYKLNTNLETFDPLTKIVKFSDGTEIKVNDKIVISPTQNSRLSKPKLENLYEIQRLTVIVKNSCKEWFENGENASIITFPTGSLKSQNKYSVQVIIMNEGSGITAPNTCVWYLSTSEKGEKGRQDLEDALAAMENSLLRESSINDFINEEDHAVALQSLKLGQSFKDFVPKEKLQYLLKFYYVQFTSIPHHGIVDPRQYRKNSVHAFNPNDAIPSEGDDEPLLIYSSLPSSEISYDGIITTAKLLFEKVVGSDDDFFRDVDFEDEDEELVSSTANVNTNQINNNSPITSEIKNSERLKNESAIDDDGAVGFTVDMEL
jgi:RAB protein geranylgeranyltransferase component A